MNLSPNEKCWLNIYQEKLQKQYPDLIWCIKIFGSKARGDAHPDSDLDILVLIQYGDWVLKKEIRYAGYDEAFELNVTPSIHVYTVNEWNLLKEQNSVFQSIVDQEGIAVG